MINHRIKAILYFFIIIILVVLRVLYADNDYTYYYYEVYNQVLFSPVYVPVFLLIISSETDIASNMYVAVRTSVRFNIAMLMWKRVVKYAVIYSIVFFVAMLVMSFTYGESTKWIESLLIGLGNQSVCWISIGTLYMMLSTATNIPTLSFLLVFAAAISTSYQVFSGFWGTSFEEVNLMETMYWFVECDNVFIIIKRLLIYAAASVAGVLISYIFIRKKEYIKQDRRYENQYR